MIKIYLQRSKTTLFTPFFLLNVAKKTNNKTENDQLSVNGSYLCSFTSNTTITWVAIITL